MMRTTFFLFLLTSSSSASLFRAGGKQATVDEAHNQHRRAKKDKGDGPCGIISQELQTMWQITDESCEQANAQRDDACVFGPIKLPGNSGCETTEECKELDPLYSCIVTRDTSGAFAATECGTLESVALEVATGAIQTYALKVVCEDKNIPQT